MADLSTDLAQKYLDIAQVILVALDINGDIVLLNRKGHEVLEYPEGSLIGKNWFETCLPERERVRVTSVFHQLLAGDVHPVEYVENPVITRSGRERLIAWHNTLLHDATGKCLGTLASGQDITESKRAEQALRESEERFRSVVETSPDVIVVATFDGRILMANQQAALLGGFANVEELLASGKNGIGFLAPEEWDRAGADIQKLAETNIIRNVEYTIVRTNGSRLPIEVNVALLRDSEGNPSSMICVVRDISERKHVEEALRETQRQAVAANQAKSEFLANMSHEIRTPMTAILGFTELLMQPDTPSEEQRGYLQTIQRNGKTLLALLDEILDLSKIEAGKMTVESTDCVLRHLIDDILAMVHVRTQEKGLSLEVDYDDLLPEIVRTDPVRLRQILANLVGNAIKFTERGGVRISVRSANMPTASEAIAPGHATIQFVISDTGIGIAPETIRRLFQPFMQADASTTRRFGGTGLGLVISKRLANLLGGDIAVTSELGCGSTFTVTVKVGVVAPQPTSTEMQGVATVQKSLPSGTTKKSPGSRVLLVEDAPDVQALLGRVFRGMQLEVEVATDGIVACEKAARSQVDGRPYDLILMDVQMPGRDGLEATEWLREHGWQGPIIALTAHAMAGDREKCLAAGCNDYLAKTAPLRELRSIVERYLFL